MYNYLNKVQICKNIYNKLFMLKLVLKVTKFYHDGGAYLFLVSKFIKRLCFNCLPFCESNGRLIMNVVLEKFEENGGTQESV
jgi:hypothetical protein